MRWKNYAACFAGLALSVPAIVAASTCAAVPFDAKAFGHRIEVAAAGPTDPSAGETLRVDGVVVDKNGILIIDEIGIAGGAKVVIGESSAGGNMCNAGVFVISFPIGRRFRFDGPLPCDNYSYEITRTGIVFRTVALPGAPGQSWNWTPSYGLKQGALVQFKTNRAFGWDEFRSKTANQPSDLYQYAPIADQIDAELGTDRDEVLPLIDGAGSGAFEGDIYVGTGCRPHFCRDAQVLVLVDIQMRKAFLAWKLEKQSVQSRPMWKTWPEAERAEFAGWIKRLQ